MKGMFPHFDPARSLDEKKIWSDAVFVFDANVLLNLYRYKASTREELLQILEKVSERIAIPYQVALEFQRNRLLVVGQLRNRIAEARNIVVSAKNRLRADLEKLPAGRKHSMIDPEPLATGFDKLADDFLAQLEKQQGHIQDIRHPDPLKSKLEEIFEGKVGLPPQDQASIDQLCREAEVRYKRRIPPGYGDADKEGSFLDGGYIYQNKFGDYLVWRQMLAAAKAAGWKTLVFVTDDAKEDWWWQVESLGSKTLGPRPELVEEARLEGGIDVFVMFNPEQFLKFAGENLEAEVSQQTLEDVRDVSEDLAPSETVDGDEFSDFAHVAVEAWLKTRFDKVEFDFYPFDYICSSGAENYAVEVVAIEAPRLATKILKRRMEYLVSHLKAAALHFCTIVVAVPTSEFAMRVAKAAAKLKMPEDVSAPTGFVFGYITGDKTFEPVVRI